MRSCVSLLIHRCRGKRFARERPRSSSEYEPKCTTPRERCWREDLDAPPLPVMPNPEEQQAGIVAAFGAGV